MSRFVNFTRLSVLTLAASVALYSGACSSDGEPPDTSNGPVDVDIADVVYLGAATDEGVALLLSASTKPSPAPSFTAPEPGTVLEAATAFSYRAGETARLELSPARRATSQARRFTNELAQLLGQERAAFAHGAPMNGPGYLLTFASADNPKVLRVFTDQASYVPSDTEWQTLVDAADDLTVTVRLAIFDEGRLAAGGGPFESAPLSFSIAVP